MKISAVVLLALLAGCALFDSRRPAVRTAWLHANPESEWRDDVTSGNLRMTMPKDAVFASWNFGAWSLESDSMDAFGLSETWSHVGTGSYVVVCFSDGKLSYFDRMR